MNPIYIHVLKEESMKIEPSNVKGLLVFCSESSKAYEIYVKVYKDAWSSKSRGMLVFLEEEITLATPSVYPWVLRGLGTC
jgi:hypothetical protein